MIAKKIKAGTKLVSWSPSCIKEENKTSTPLDIKKQSDYFNDFDT